MLPPLNPILDGLSSEAKSATLVVWQFCRAFAGPLGLRGRPSLQGLESALRGGANESAEVDGSLATLHVALLHILLRVEEDPLANLLQLGLNESSSSSSMDVDHTEAESGARIAAATEAPSDVQVGVSVTEVAAEEVVGAKARAEAMARLQVELPAGIVTKLREAQPLVSAASWPEVLRQLVGYWVVAEQEADDRTALEQLAHHLTSSEYASAAADLKALVGCHAPPHPLSGLRRPCSQPYLALQLCIAFMLFCDTLLPGSL